MNYFVTYKPFNVLSQFSSEAGKKTLKDYFDVPVNVYPVGRLDYDSEGLLILTNDKHLNKQLLSPELAHEREYWVQVEGTITTGALQDLKNGVIINIDGKMYKTKQCIAEVFKDFPTLPSRQPPIRFRKNVSDSWIKLILMEGKNRQVRKMTAKVGFPTLRLVRFSIERINIDKLQPGEMKILSKGEMYTLLNIKC